MEIKTWEVAHIFEPPLKGEYIQMVGVELPKPAGLEERIRASWNEQLLKKQGELTLAGISTEIRSYHLDRSENPLRALYEGDASGIVLDQEILPNKPDLTGWVRTVLDAGDIRERMFRTDPNKRPTDVQSVVFAPASEEGLLRYLTEYTHPVNFCPPTVGSLWLFGKAHYGDTWANGVIRKLGF